MVELVLRYAVEAFGLLLCAQLDAIFRNFLAALAMLAGNSAFAGYDCTFVRIASLTLQEQLFGLLFCTVCRKRQYILPYGYTSLMVRRVFS